MKELEQMFIKSYETYSDEIFRFVFFKLNNREKAKDMVQDVFMKVWIYITKNGQVENMRAFLYKTASNAVIDEYRRAERKDNKMQSLDVLSELGFESGFDDTDALIDKIDGKKVLEVVSELPDIYSEVIFMRYIEEKSITEISEIISQTENTVSVRINRAIKKLKDTVEEKQKIKQ